MLSSTVTDNIINFINFGATHPLVIAGECYWNDTEFELTLNNLRNKILYANISSICTLIAGAVKILKVYLSLNMQANFVNMA
jgi:hypothetical protein